MKHFREVTMMFQSQYFAQATIGFQSDLSASMDTVTVQGAFGGLWGQFKWGQSPWGGTQRAKPIRTLVSLEKARCSQLSITFKCSASYSSFQLQGYSTVFNLVSERMTR